MAEWKNATYPDGCRNCGTTERRSMGRGLCSRCYQDPVVKDRYDPIRRMDDDMGDTTDDLGTTATIDDDFLAGVPFDGQHDSVGGGRVVQDTLTADDPVTGPYSPGERSPGGLGSSSATGAAPSEAKSKKLFDRFRKAPKVDADQEAAPRTKEKRPKAQTRPGRRASAADTLGDVWSGVGSLAIRSGRHAPLGRCLQFQAPVAGEMLDEAVKGTFVDKLVLQPVVKTRGRFDLLGAVMGPPLIVLAMERNPQQADVLMPMLRSSIRASLPFMVPAIKKVQEKERKAQEAAADLFPDLPPGEDPVDAIIAMMFADWVPPAPPQNYDTDDTSTNESDAA